MEIDLVPLEKADGSGRMWVVPDRIRTVEPSPQTPAKWSVVTMTSGHAWTFVGTVEEIREKLKDAKHQR